MTTLPLADATLSDDAWLRRLDEALPAANLPTLLMVLTHLSGDERWLGERYQCTKVRGLDDNDPGGLPDAVRAEVLAAARDALLQWRRTRRAALRAPSPETLVRMMRTSVGEAVPDTYGAILSAGLGLDPEFALDQREAFQVPPGFRAIVIGAGVAGLCASIRLQGAGIEHTVIEKNEEVGGTWFENRYPGAGVDTPNHIYSFSFAPHDWSRHFALRDEIQRYFEGVADSHGLRERIRFGTRVEQARYDERRHRWQVQVAGRDGRRETLHADLLISAVGLLNVPKMPAIPGLDGFEGDCFHTARWPEGLSVAGKDVAVIGNGASAMQVVPAIAGEVRTLTVFQRSKQWAAPFEKFKQPVDEARRFLLRELPYYQAWYRQRLAWIFNDRIHGSLQIDPAWPHPERSINRTNDRHRAFFTDYIKAELGERQDLLPEVLPDYPPFGKRMLMDNGWYRTMTRDNVRLVTGGVRAVEGDCIVGDDGRRHRADVLVIATGFDAVNMLSSFDLLGRGGRSVREAWAEEGAQAFVGMAVPGFPNFFCLTGPNTALGHGGSVVALIESQVRYVMGLVRQALQRHPRGFEIEVREDAHRAYDERVQAAHAGMIWSHRGMSNWYRNDKGRVVATTPFRNDDHWHLLRRTSLADYALKGAGEAGQGARQPAAEELSS